MLWGSPNSAHGLRVTQVHTMEADSANMDG